MKTRNHGVVLRSKKWYYYERAKELGVKFHFGKSVKSIIKRKKQKEFVKDFVDDPRALIEEIESIFGFDYVE